VYAHEHGDRCISGRNLFERDEVGAGVRAQSIILLGHHHAEESELAKLLHQARLEVGLLIPLGRVRSDFRPRELARELLNLGLFFS